MNPLPRPRLLLDQITKAFPDAWKNADLFRADMGRDGLPEWPSFCFLPIAGWLSIAEACGTQANPLQQLGRVSELAALGAWRYTQGIYRFDPDLLAALVDTPLDGDLPQSILYRLPEWSVYVETPGLTYLGNPAHGFFAFLEHDVNTHKDELRLLIDCDDQLASMPVPIGPWAIRHALTQMSESARKNIEAAGGGSQVALPGTSHIAELSVAIAPFLSLLLYLCAENAEYPDGQRPSLPRPVKTKRGPKLFAPAQARVWDMGVRIGAALRRARASSATGNGQGGHAAPRPHIRRAHWHGFRSGPIKDSQGVAIPTVARPFALKWLPPIPVSMDTPDDLPATIHPVR